jgi:endonuclease G
MRKKKKKQTNSKKQVVLLIILIICGIATAYQTTSSKEKTAASEQTETIIQNLPLNSDIYIKQTTAPAPPKYFCNAPDTSYLITPIPALPTG